MEQKSFFKFRNIDSVLKKKELEDQYIWFSGVKKLSDPCEMLCAFVFYTTDPDYWINSIFRPFIREIYKKTKKLFTKLLIPRYEVVQNNKDFSNFHLFHNFIKEYPVEKCLTIGLQNLAKKLCNEKISVYTVQCILNIIYETIEKNIYNYIEGINNFADYDFSLLSLSKYEYVIEQLKLTEEQIIKLNRDNKSKYLIKEMIDRIAIKAKKDRKYPFKLPLSLQTPTFTPGEKFINKLYQKYYTLNRRSSIGITCFCETYNQVRMWNDYTKMKGICLEFKFNTIENHFNQKDDRKKLLIPIYKVNYGKTLPGLDFFKFIKLMTISKIENLPNYVEDKVFHEWLNIFIPIFTAKLTDYENEKEWRMISLSQCNVGYVYDFSNLHSITFAPKTKDKHKREIIEIIVKKSKENKRKEFKIYQSYLDPSSGRVERFTIFDKVSDMKRYLQQSS